MSLNRVYTSCRHVCHHVAEVRFALDNLSTQVENVRVDLMGLSVEFACSLKCSLLIISQVHLGLVREATFRAADVLETLINRFPVVTVLQKTVFGMF